VLEKIPTLLVRAGSRVCALRIGDVTETMRPLPVQGVPGAPAYVKGLAIVRGAPVPVLELAALVGAQDAGTTTRFVAIRAGGRPLVLAVDSVVGVRELDPGALHEVAPVLGGTSLDLVEAVGALDRDLLLILRAARTISDSLWQSLGLEAGTP
jgi:purine-binding chemotaxis protein CheW